MTKCYFKCNFLNVLSLNLHLSGVKNFPVLLNGLSTGEDEEGTPRTLAIFTTDGYFYHSLSNTWLDLCP